MGATIQALVDLGLVERRQDPADGRRTLVRATPAGASAREDAWAARSRVLTELLGTLSPEDRETVARSLAILETLVEP
jgi:DNA-binding MarR family transcriptional regulator